MTKRLVWAVAIAPVLYAATQHGSDSTGAEGRLGNHVIGLLTGILLFLLTEPALLYGTFKIWFRNPNHPTPPAPERYFHAAVFSIVAMVFTAAILTFTFSGVDVAHSPLVSRFGFNNVCVLFDFPPSTYICPVYWFFVAYFIGRYAVEDTKRLMRLESIGAGQKALCYSVNVFLVMSVALFFLIFSISPIVDLVGHTTPFLFLIFTMPSVFLMHYFQHEQRSKSLKVGISIYVALSLVKIVSDIYALSSGNHIPPTIAQSVDILWTLCTLSAPFLMPAPVVIGTKANKDSLAAHQPA
jgi:hypothetical protein